MIEIIILKYLTEKLSVPVYMEDDGEVGDTYVVVEKTGGGEENFLKSAVIAVQSYADTLYNAASINEEVKEAMKKLIEEDKVTKCELNSDYNYTDTARKVYRYQAVFDIKHY